MGAVIFELHAARDLREDGVVLAEASVEPRPKPPASLPDDNRTPGHHVAVVRLDAEPLRVRVAAVAGTALSLLMSHLLLPRLNSGRGQSLFLRRLPTR